MRLIKTTMMAARMRAVAKPRMPTKMGGMMAGFGTIWAGREVFGLLSHRIRANSVCPFNQYINESGAYNRLRRLTLLDPR